MAKITVYKIIVDGRHKETAGTWSQAQSAINKYKALSKNVRWEEVKK